MANERKACYVIRENDPNSNFPTAGRCVDLAQ